MIGDDSSLHASEWSTDLALASIERAVVLKIWTSGILDGKPTNREKIGSRSLVFIYYHHHLVA